MRDTKAIISGGGKVVVVVVGSSLMLTSLSCQPSEDVFIRSGDEERERIDENKDDSCAFHPVHILRSFTVIHKEFDLY